MKDTYPDFPSLPPSRLVPKDRQPDYLEPPDLAVPPNANVGRALIGAAPGNALALIDHDRHAAFTFDDLRCRSGVLAAVLLDQGLEIGERVAIRSGNRPEGVIAAVGVWRAGGVVVPTPPQARTPELRFLLDDTDAAMIVADADDPTFSDVMAAVDGTDVRGIAFSTGCESRGWKHWDPAATETVGVSDIDTPASLPAIIWHTGGTTGTPKACYHTHRRYLLGGYTFAQATLVAPGDRWLAAAPIGHALGFLSHTSFTLLHGATAVMVQDFANPAALLTAIAAHDVSTVIAIAATWSRLLDVLDAHPDLDRIPTLRRAYAMWQSASSSTVYDRWLGRGVELLNNFGSTAFANWVLVPRDDGIVTPRGSLGAPTPGYEVRALETESNSLDSVPVGTVGRMGVRGPTGLTYWNRPREQERDVVGGWTLVDDLVEFNDVGYAAYHGRTDFIISSGGYKIVPVEVESALARHPLVKEVGVVGAPDPLRSEITTAFVVLHETHPDDDRDVLISQLQEFVKSQIAPYKYPRRIEFVKALPRDPVGKLLPRVLKDWAATGVPPR